LFCPIDPVDTARWHKPSNVPSNMRWRAAHAATIVLVAFLAGSSALTDAGRTHPGDGATLEWGLRVAVVDRVTA
jgi:hypothetical protein